MPFPTCPHCGEPKHHDLCRQALAVLYAEERVKHEEDRRKMARLEIEVADLRLQMGPQ